MKGKFLFRTIFFILIIATIVCSVVLEQKRLDENEYQKFNDSLTRDEYIDSVINLYTSFHYLGVMVILYSIYSLWEFLLYKNIDGKLYKVILVIIFNFLAMVRVCAGYQWISYSKRIVIKEGEILPILPLIKSYILAFGFIGLSKIFKRSIEKEYEKEVEKILESDYGKRWLEFNNKLAKKQ